LFLLLVKIGTEAVGVDACPLGQRPLLGKKRKKGDQGGGVRPEAIGLHIEEVGNDVVIHAVLGVACEQGVPGDHVPRGHFGEDIGGCAEASAPDVQINEGSRDEEVCVETGGGGMAVDGAAAAEISKRRAGFENKGEGALVGGDAAAEHGAVEVDGGMERSVPGVGADEGVEGARVRRGDSVEHLKGEVQVPVGNMLLLRLQSIIDLVLVREGNGGRSSGGRRRWRRDADEFAGCAWREGEAAAAAGGREQPGGDDRRAPGPRTRATGHVVYWAKGLANRADQGRKMSGCGCNHHRW
jgi:hypothetical protein